MVMEKSWNFWNFDIFWNFWKSHHPEFGPLENYQKVFNQNRPPVVPLSSHGILWYGHGKIMEILWNFVAKILWQPWNIYKSENMKRPAANITTDVRSRPPEGDSLYPDIDLSHGEMG